MGTTLAGFEPQRAFSLDGSVAVITGGGNGIGRGIAIGMARAGARVHVLDRDSSAAKYSKYFLFWINIFFCKADARFLIAFCASI